MAMRRLARPLLATAFVVDGLDALTDPQERAKAAADRVTQIQRRLPEQYAAKVPDAGRIVRVNAAAQIGGGLLLALGRAPRLAAAILAVTVIPATVTEQDFWAEQNPELRSAKRTAFLKDLSLLGGLLIASTDHGGRPPLLRTIAEKAAAGAGSAATAAEIRAAHLAETAKERGSDVAEVVRERGSEVAGVVKERGSDVARTVKDRAPEVADAVKERGAELGEVIKDRGAELGEALKDRSAEWGEVLKHRGSDFGDVARERGSELAGVARVRGAEWADVARERGAELAEVAKDRGAELGTVAKHRGSRFARSVRRSR
ncbi:DoxX family membrane protein [Nocardia sp. NPDC005978]|uniref:DoxX family membrane protein n=1 Tax=unclassified Nocardia TaxID=2637762 RepID=UPI0033B3B2E1